MKVYVLLARDGSEIYGVHRSLSRAQKEAEKRTGGTLAWAGGGSDQFYRYTTDYRIARVPAHLAPKPSSKARPRAVQ